MTVPFPLTLPIHASVCHPSPPVGERDNPGRKDGEGEGDLR